ncbi:hypothetical protein [Marinobacter sp. F4218]|uniref:hypothetical protein n=1 Tax=Marinobacter sp. F4218 TaxID=2862868 RepID=UPI001C63873C|nr:hypothetical protein [Marinobacter sp. F4218]MBW7472594.1 hypothetical protein [Marinobacter sp. F4218]
MKTLSESFRTLSILVLAASIFYFGYAVLRSADRISEGLQKASGIAESLKPAVELAPEFLNESEQLRFLARDALKETEAVRLLVPSVLKESEAIRNTLPQVIQQADLLRQESINIRSEVAAVRSLMPQVLAELEAYRAIIPSVLEESQNIRRTIPPTLDRVEKIVADANEIASSAGEKTFTNVITGIIKAPINLLGNAAQMLVPSDVRLSDEDRARLESRLQTFLNTAEVGNSEEFVTSDGSITGRFELVSDSFEGGESCRMVALNSFRKGELLRHQDLQICRNDEGRWYLKNMDESRK